MTLKELMLGNIQSNQGSAIMQMNAQTTQKSADKTKSTTFGDILGNRISKTVERQNYVKSNDSNVNAGKKNTEPISDKAVNKPRFLTFREVNDKNLKASDSESTDRQKTKLDEKNDSHPYKADNDILYIFAQVLGVDVGDLQKLLKDAGITSESFNNKQNISENASKLSQLLGLNEEQQETLVKMLQLTEETMDSVTALRTETDVQKMMPSDTNSAISSAETIVIPEASKTTKSPESSGASETSLPGTTESVIDAGIFGTVKAAEALPSNVTAETNDIFPATSAFETLAEKLGLKIKVKLNELNIKLKSDQSAVGAEVEQFIQFLQGKPAAKINESVKQAVDVNNGEMAEQIVKTDGEKAETTPSKDDGTGKGSNAKAEKETATLKFETIVKGTQPQATISAVQPDKVNGMDVIGKAAVKTPVTTKEIISQVVEQAKVILTPDKSEMVMDLKPDSLGKISLKVVTENGIVMAKFIAENQQVRQVLETNMQLLKDSLERQGMNVQGFSVSVRQDSNRSTKNWTQPERSRNRSITGTAYRTTGMAVNLADALEATGRSDPYYWTSNTINLTA